jgi:hypothetical protein
MSNSGLSDSFQFTEEKLAKNWEFGLGSATYASPFNLCNSDESASCRASNSALDIWGTWLQ